MPRVIVAALAALLLLSHAEARAQAYPSKPIRFVIPFGAGSATDALARIVGQELEQTLGQPIIVVQKPGADGALAAGVQRLVAHGGIDAIAVRRRIADAVIEAGKYPL